MRSRRRLFAGLSAVAALLASSLVASGARADNDDPHSFGFGIYPKLRVGASFGKFTYAPQANAYGMTPDPLVDKVGGFLFEPDLEAIVVFPGDLFAVGVFGGYSLGLGNSAGSGPVVGPTVLFALTNHFLLRVEGAWCGVSVPADTSIFPPLPDDSYWVSGFRVGGGFRYLLGRRSSISLDYDRYVAMSGQGSLGEATSLDLNAVTMSVEVSFAP